MSNINKFLANILAARYGKDVRQSIHDAIKEVDSVADTARDSATKSAESALASEISAKASMEASSESELKAKGYMEQAFSGTPDGYSALIEQVDSIDIKTSNEYELRNTKAGGYRLTDLVGATEQNGEPTPTTPIAIENTFDCVEMEQGWYNTSGVKASAPDCVRSIMKIPCKEGDSVVISNDFMKSYTITYFNGDTFVNRVSSINMGTSCIIPSGVDYFSFHLNSGTTITLDAVGKITLTVNGKYVGQIVRSNKVLFDVSSLGKLIGVALDSNGQLVTKSSAFTDKKIKLNFKEKTAYTLSIKSGKYTGTYTGVKIQYADGTTKSVGIDDTSPGYTEKVLTSDKDKTIDYIYFSPSYYSANMTIEYFQIEEGEVATSIEPRIEKITTFYLNEPLRDTDRIVRANGVLYEEHKITEVDLGNLNWRTLTYNSIVLMYSDDIQSAIYSPNFYKPNNILCTHYSVTNANDLSAVPYDKHISTNDTGRIYVYDSNYTNATAFKSAMSGVMFQYELKTPTLTPLDTESQLALNDMVIFDGATYIEVDSKVKPSGISGEYGTSQVGAYTLKCMNDNDTDRVERAELKAQIETLTSALLVLTSESEGE